MRTIRRREFLGSSAAALAAGLAAPLAFADTGKKVSPSEKVTVALVGCGSMGKADLRHFIEIPDFEVVALCDPDPKQIETAVDELKKGNRPTDKLQTEKDFRRVTDRKDLDAVIIGTPDHWHPYILIDACAKGKDVYCEKPLSHNIAEGRAMVEAARKHKRVVQVGTQQRSGQHFQDAIAHVQSGKLGNINLCRTWICNGTGPEGSGNPPDSDPPPGVDYDLWLGPAPKRAFNPNRFHREFRWFWDYGNGLCNDWGVHLSDVILWGMKQTAPISVTAHGGKHEMQDNSDTPDTLDIWYEYPGFTHVYTVRRGKTLFGFPEGMRYGMQFQGDRATLTLDRHKWYTTPVAADLKPEMHGESEMHIAHKKNFLHCIRNRSQPTASDIEAMHRATTCCHLANISYKVGRRIWWDPVRERCCRGYDPVARKFLEEDAEANAYLLREPRKPWSLSS